jgi:hypothetical protein
LHDTARPDRVLGQAYVDAVRVDREAEQNQYGRQLMRVFAKFAAALLCAVLLPTAAYAQASLAGVVRDTSGAVLPGVTVEATSPVLIEKVRTAVTDGNGRFQIIDLRPGTYSVTFTLPGFNTVKREGIELSGAATITVDAELRVGALEETITVTGEAAAVDTSSTTRQLVLDRDTVQLVPSGRNYYNLGAMVVGVNSNSADVGGALGDTMSSLTTHGSKNTDQRITNNGVNIMTLQAGGNIGGATPDVSSAAEVTIDTSSVSAEMSTGGVRINLIPRDGGNTWASSSFVSFSNESLQGDNLTDRLMGLGLTAAAKSVKIWDINPAFGGPIVQDRAWFWFSGRYQGAQNQPADSFYNRNAWNPDAWLPDLDTSQPTVNKGVWHSLQLRGTIQATPRNKFAFTWQEQNYCRCPDEISATRTLEAGRDRRFPRLQQQHAEWTSPVTSRLLLEAVGMHLYERWGDMHLRSGEGNFFITGGSLDPQYDAFVPQMISVTEQSTGLTYRSRVTFNNTAVPNFAYRAAVSYVTGTHNFKAGWNLVHGYQDTRTYNFQPVSYRFNNGVPNQLTQYATPYTLHNVMDGDMGLFAQDRWSLDRWTLTLGIRYDQMKTSFGEQNIGASLLDPNRNLTFAEQGNLDWKDITPRFGAVYDVFGNGRTALKVSLNKYLNGQTLNGLGNTPNPFNQLVLTTTRSWNDATFPVGDPRRNNYVPDCVITNNAANGECGAVANSAFGSTRQGDLFDPDLLTGWGNRNYNWEFSTSVQHEIVPRVSADFGYFRRWFGNFQVTDNLLVTREDYTEFSLVAPTDPRLPDGGGYTVTGLFDVVPAKFGQSQNLNTLSDKYGKQIEHWNGVDLSLNARLQNGITLRGGVATGKRTMDNCDVVQQLPEMLFGSAGINLGANNNNVWLPEQWCHQEEPFLTSYRASGIYTIPKVDVLVTASFYSNPGQLVAANYTVTNAIRASSSTLTRPFSGNAANISVNIAQPGEVYYERLNQLDMRVGKIIRFGGNRATVNLDIYNALNADAITGVNNSFSSWVPGAEDPRPTSALLPRFAKISATFDF